MKTTVLDASALLAMFFGEPGVDMMRDLFHRAAEADRPLLVSAVNWAEVLYRLSRQRGQEGLEVARHFGRTMPLHVVPVDLEQAEMAAEFKATRKLALADAFAAALAKHKKAELVTGDQEFRAVAKEITIEWLK
ncbi:MAG: PIN domain-containing protein [Verrucomicrobiia bacterium]